MFDRVEPLMGEPERVSYAHHNLLSRFRVFILRKDLDSMDELEEIAVELERSYETGDMEPIPPEKFVFPDLAYKPPKQASGKRSVSFAVTTATAGGANPHFPVVKRPTPVPSTARPINNPAVTAKSQPQAAPRNPESNASTSTCWNCQKTGHLSRECTGTRILHCYRCGKPGVTTRVEHKCPGNANQDRR